LPSGRSEINVGLTLSTKTIRPNKTTVRHNHLWGSTTSNALSVAQKKIQFRNRTGRIPIKQELIAAFCRIAVPHPRNGIPTFLINRGKSALVASSHTFKV
jgi:hypothetical protein